MMRRELLAFLGSAASLWPFLALAQQGAKMPRIGFLSPRLDTMAPLRDAFIEGLRELGYITQPFDVSTVIDNSYADAAVNQLGPYR